MDTIFQILTYIILFLSVLLGTIAFTRRPRSGMKISFMFVCFFLFVSNALAIFSKSDFFLSIDSIHIISEYSLYISILIFSLYFPNFFRNMPLINHFLWFIIGFVASSGLYELMMEERAIMRSATVYFLVYISMGLIIYLKTWKYFLNIKSFMKSSILIYLVLIGFFFLDSVYIQDEFSEFQSLHQWNLLFLFLFFAFLGHFTFHSNYVSIPLSTLFERSEKVLHQIRPASKKGSAELKSILLEYYENSRLKDYVEEFHFHLLVDETLDNAIEHGGKRSYDDITVFVFESKEFTDIYVIDRGKGFNPKKIPNPLNEDRKLIPSGRGIHILKGLFIVRWNFLGNEVCVRIPNPLQKNKENI